MRLTVQCLNVTKRILPIIKYFPEKYQIHEIHIRRPISNIFRQKNWVANNLDHMMDPLKRLEIATTITWEDLAVF